MRYRSYEPPIPLPRHLHIDNIRVSGTRIKPDSFITAIALEPELDGIDLETNPDPDGDEHSLLLEYAFGGSFLEVDDPAANSCSLHLV
ncbi:MAG: hypothetical protein ACI8XO_002878 [Verrucomicrobiales bacterium]|jgi:hypothetical protein